MSWAVQMVMDLEEEFGNPILSLSNYTDNSPLFLANQMKTSGIKGVVIAHGVLDGEVTSDQSVQMLTTLLLNGVPTDISAVVTKTPGTPSGLTLDGDLLGLVPGYESPFAGHVSQLVMNTALAKLDLDALLEVWPAVLDQISEQNHLLCAALREARPIAFDANTLTLAFEATSAFHRRQAEEPAKRTMISEAIRTLTGTAPRVAFETRELSAVGAGGADGPAPIVAPTDQEWVDRFKAEFDAEEIVPDDDPPSP